MDDDAAARRHLAPVALAPDVRVLGEVRGAVPGAVGVLPEAHRHRGKGPGADQLSLLVPDRSSIFIEHLHGHAEAFALISPRHTAPGGLPETEQEANAVAAADGHQDRAALVFG